jgi:hypothetical protein
MTSETGEILEVPKKKGTFVKGYDPRRNLRGVPKDTIKGRALIRKIGAELIHIEDKAAGESYDITRAEAMIRLMYSSKAPADKKALIDALWPGLLKQEVDITTGGEKLTEITIKYDTNNDNPTETPPSTAPGQTDPEKV